MSEYQYYEFLAIDRPLTTNEMEELRAISTRAEITPVSFVNFYSWGNFKGDPDKLMERYFDAHVYVANWMTSIFKLRIPKEALSKETVAALSASEAIEFKATKNHWIVTWRLDESEDYGRFEQEEGRGWMARLAPVRDELLRGDLRSLYIGWLATVSWGITDDDDSEPIQVNGLGQLTSAQRSLAEFLEVDDDLLAGAGIGSPAAQDEKATRKEMDSWIDELTKDEISEILKQILSGKGRQAERAVLNRFEAWRRDLKGDGGEASRRTVRELQANALIAEKIRLQKEREKRTRQEAKQRKEREAYLQKLSKDFPGAWKSVQRTVETGSGLAYEKACQALVDLSEAYAAHASKERFQEQLRKFMAGNLKRKALVQRLMKAGIWDDNDFKVIGVAP